MSPHDIINEAIIILLFHFPELFSRKSPTFYFQTISIILRNQGTNLQSLHHKKTLIE